MDEIFEYVEILCDKHGGCGKKKMCKTEAEVFCSFCGIDYTDKAKELGFIKDDYDPTLDIDPSSHAKSNIGSSTVISTKAAGGGKLTGESKKFLYRIQQLERKGWLTSSGNDKKDFDNIGNFEHVYDSVVPEKYIEKNGEEYVIKTKTREIYRKIIHKNLQKGRNRNFMVVAAFLITAKLYGINPNNLLDILEKNKLDSLHFEEFSFINQIWTYYRLIIFELGLKMPILEHDEEIKIILYKLSKAELKFSSGDIFKSAKEIIRKSNERGIGGHQSTVVVGSAVFLALLQAKNDEIKSVLWREVDDRYNNQSILRVSKEINETLELGLSLN